jgi:protein-tyrosine phosphatase
MLQSLTLNIMELSFDTYVNIHHEAYQDLQQNDEIIPEDKCVRDLLTGIKDQSLNVAKQIIMAIQELRSEFATAVLHCYNVNYLLILRLRPCLGER